MATSLRVIEPRRGWVGVRWGDLWRNRGLLFVLVWRDIKIRYRYTVLGIAWALLQPLVSVALFVVLFGRWGGLDSRVPGGSYSAYVLCGMVPWLFFTAAVTASSRVLLTASSLITKTAFPRLLLPLSSAATAGVDFAVSMVVVLVFVLARGFLPTGQIALLPVVLFGFVLLTAGVCAFVSSVTIQFRDLQHVIPFAVQIGMFLAPIVYPAALVPERWRFLLLLNPVTGYVETLRAALLGTPIPWLALVGAVAWTAATFIGGALWFARMERSLADIL